MPLTAVRESAGAVQPAEPLRVALVGAGSAAIRAHLPALERMGAGARVVGVVDVDPERAAAVANGLPDARPHSRLESLFEAERPELVVVVTPPSAHLPAVRSALRNGADVLCEKPLGVTDAEARDIAVLARQHPGQLLATVLQYRCASGWRRLTEEVAEATRLGHRWHLAVEVERPGTDPLSAGSWRGDSSVDGGILGDHAVHYLGLCWNLDHDARIAGSSSTPGGETAAIDLELDGGTASIHATYRGARRRNRIVLERPGRPALSWEGPRLATAGSGSTETVEDLSDRTVVNNLYAHLYGELLRGRASAEWRAERRAETVGVAVLLARCAAASDGSGGRVP